MTSRPLCLEYRSHRQISGDIDTAFETKMMPRALGQADLLAGVDAGHLSKMSRGIARQYSVNMHAQSDAASSLINHEVNIR